MSSDGTQMPVEAIMGADDMYDVVKFRVGIPGKKVTALTLAAVAPAAGADVYLCLIPPKRTVPSLPGK